MDLLSTSPALGPMSHSSGGSGGGGHSSLLSDADLSLDVGASVVPHDRSPAVTPLRTPRDDMGHLAPSMLDLSESGMAQHQHASRHAMHLTHSPNDMHMESDLRHGDGMGDAMQDSMGGIGMMPEASSSSINGELMQSHSPLLLSTGAPLIGDMMPNMSLGGDGDSMSAAEPAAAAAAHLSSPAKEAAAAAVHDQIQSLEAMRAQIEADLAQAMRAKQRAGQGRNQQGTRKKARTPAGAAAASKLRWAKKKAEMAATAAAAAAAAAGTAPVPESSDVGATADTGAPVVAPAAPPAAPSPVPVAPAAPSGIQSHSSERRYANSAQAVQQAKDTVSLANTSLLPAGILSCTDETLLQPLLDALASTLSPQSRSSFVPRYLKLSLPDVSKEIAWLEKDLAKKRMKYAATLTANAALANKKGAAAAMAAAAAAMGEPSQATRDTVAAACAQLVAAGGLVNQRVLPLMNGNGSSTLNSKLRHRPNQSASSTAATTGAGVTAPKRKHSVSTPADPDAPRSSRSSRTSRSTRPEQRPKFVPCASPTLGQIVCVCKMPYDGTPVNGPNTSPAASPETGDAAATAQPAAPADAPKEPAAIPDSNGAAATAESAAATLPSADAAPSPDSLIPDIKMEPSQSEPDVKVEEMKAEPTVKAEAAIKDEPAPVTADASADTPMTDATVAASAVDTPPATNGDTAASSDAATPAPSDAPAAEVPSAAAPMDVDVAAASPSASPISSDVSGSDSGVVPPSPYLIPCQRCSAWFHPSCLRLSALEALTPYVCRKHASAQPPAPRQLMRPTSSRHERLLEREKIAEIPSANVLLPTSPYYIPEAEVECANMPPEMEDEPRDNRLFVALREMMQLYHLSQHDVCISSNLSGGQAALSSMMNGRKIANIGRKQFMLRKWLWKFETFQKNRYEHAVQHHIPRPALGTPVSMLVPPMRTPSGALVQAGHVAAGHTLDWPPVIRWKSYFDALTPEEKAADEAQRISDIAAHQARVASLQQAKLAAKAAQSAAGAAAAASRAAAKGLNSSVPLPSTNGSAAGAAGLSASMPLTGSSGNMPRLRTVHHAPLKYAQSPTEDDEQASPASTRLSGGTTPSGDGDDAARRRSLKRKDHSGLPFDNHSFPSLANGADPESFSHRYNIGDKLDCRVTPATDSPWLPCIVRDVRSCAVLLHFLRTPDQYDQWVNTRSKRLGEFGQHSQDKKRQSDGLSLEEIVKQAFKEYVRAEREAAKDGYTGGAPLWSGKKRPDLVKSLSSAAAARKRAKVSHTAASVSSTASSSDASDSEQLDSGPPRAGESVNTNQDECEVCGKGGSLLCCDGCPKSYHGTCCEPKVDVKALLAAGDDEPWFCAKCSSKKKTT